MFIVVVYNSCTVKGLKSVPPKKSISTQERDARPTPVESTSEIHAKWKEEEQRKSDFEKKKISIFPRNDLSVRVKC